LGNLKLSLWWSQKLGYLSKNESTNLSIEVLLLYTVSWLKIKHHVIVLKEQSDYLALSINGLVCIF